MSQQIFTKREASLIPYLCLTSKEIANVFSLSESTIIIHLANMRKKVGAKNKAKLIEILKDREMM